MLASFLLAFREGVEAALIIGILLGALRKLGRKDLSPVLLVGVLLALLVSGLVAFGLHAAGASLSGDSEEIFEGFTMLLAAALLTWMIFWMQHQSRSLRGKIETNIRQAVDSTGGWSLLGVAFVAVVKEGIELALLLVAAGFNEGASQFLLGVGLGLTGAVLLGWILFTSTRRLPLSRFFQVTNILLLLFAAGLVAHGVHAFNEIGWVPGVIEHLYNVNPWLNEASPVGSLLTALFGFNGNPSLTESLAYLAYFVILGLSLLRFQHKPAASLAR